MSRKTFRKVIVTPEILDRVNPINKKIVERYLRNFDTKRSDKSVVVKRSDYNIFMTYLYIFCDNKPMTEIKKYELMDFFDYGVNSLNWGTSRFCSMHSSLNTLFTFIENFLDEDYPEFRNNMAKIEKPVKQVAREKTVLTEEQINSLIKHLKATEKNNQKLVYLLLCIGSGVRISESLRITTDLIDETNLAFGDAFLKTTQKIKTKGFGKKGEPKYKYIFKDLFLPEYKIWLKQRKEILKSKNKEHKAIFIKANGEPATNDVVNYWIKQWEKFLTEDKESNPKGEQVNFYAHALRHYIVTLMARKGIPQELVVAIMGWKTADINKCVLI